MAQWQRWSGSLADSVALFARSPARVLQLDSPAARRIEVPESDFAAGGTGDKSLFWHLIDCGGFRIAGINAEPMVEYRQAIAKYMGDVPLLTAGCLDQTHCYLPTDEMIAEGGYEVEGFRPLFNFKGRFRNKIEESVIGRLNGAAKKPHPASV